MPKEREVAREAIYKIQAWLGDKPKFGGEGNFPRLSVKFCGGCNPQLDRAFLWHIIRETLVGQVLWVPWEEEADLLLILNGCPVSCADRQEVREKSGLSLMISGDVVSAIERGAERGQGPFPLPGLPAKEPASGHGCLSKCPEK